MHPDLLNILSKKDLPITNAQLIDYLTGKLSDADNQVIEETLAAGGQLEDDALEGLQLLKNKAAIHGIQHELIQGLHHTIRQQKTKRRPKKLLQLNWILLMAAGLMALAFIAWFIIWMMKQNG